MYLEMKNKRGLMELQNVILQQREIGIIIGNMLLQGRQGAAAAHVTVTLQLEAEPAADAYNV